MRDRCLLSICLTVGAICFGRNLESADSENLWVVNAPLVRAVQIEKPVGYPCVVVDTSVAIEEVCWESSCTGSGK